MKELKLRYKTPAERTNEGWEKYSLPIGNGYSGASVFGGTDMERVQFTTNVFANPFRLGGVSNFLELFIDFNDKAEKYERGLDLRTGIAYSGYVSDFGSVKRKAFFSYPDNVFVYRAEFAKPKDLLRVRAEIPYLGDSCGCNRRRKEMRKRANHPNKRLIRGHLRCVRHFLRALLRSVFNA